MPLILSTPPSGSCLLSCGWAPGISSCLSPMSKSKEGCAEHSGTGSCRSDAAVRLRLQTGLKSLCGGSRGLGGRQRHEPETIDTLLEKGRSCGGNGAIQKGPFEKDFRLQTPLKRYSCLQDRSELCERCHGRSSLRRHGLTHNSDHL